MTETIKRQECIQPKTNSEKYIVYCGRDYTKKIVYIGQGKKGRQSHLNSGASHCVEANRYFFSGKRVRVEILGTFDNQDDAKFFEAFLINKMKPKWNSFTPNLKKNWPDPKCKLQQYDAYCFFYGHDNPKTLSVFIDNSPFLSAWRKDLMEDDEAVKLVNDWWESHPDAKKYHK